jgi:hypothetical protein
MQETLSPKTVNLDFVQPCQMEREYERLAYLAHGFQRLAKVVHLQFKAMLVHS